MAEMCWMCGWRGLEGARAGGLLYAMGVLDLRTETYP